MLMLGQINMSELEFLPTPDLRRFGGTREAQCKAMDELGIPYKRVGKDILVSRYHARQWLLGEKLKQSAGPRLDLVR